MKSKIGWLKTSKNLFNRIKINSQIEMINYWIERIETGNFDIVNIPCVKEIKEKKIDEKK